MIKNFKVVLVGDGGVGKTSLVRRILNKKFSHDYSVTVGVDIYSHLFKGKDKNSKIRWIICDFSGQITFNKIISQFGSGANIVFLVFDITRKNTLYNIYSWVNEIKERVSKDAIFILVGNKTDLRGSTETVPKEEAENVAKALSEILERPVVYIEVSALTGENVPKLINYVLKKLFSSKLARFSG